MSFADLSTTFEAGPAQVVVYPLAVDRVVSLAGSFDLGPDFARDEDVHAALVASLLDKGTRRRDRFEVAAVLEERGARLGYSAGGVRLDFSARCLADDLPVVIEILAESLIGPALDAAELEKVSNRMVGALRRDATDPASLASGAFSRLCFAPGHPLFEPAPQADIDRLSRVDRDVVAGFHGEAFSGPGLRVVAVGSVPTDLLLRSLERGLAAWPTRARRPIAYVDPAPGTPAREDCFVADRPNVEVRLGHALSIRRNDEDYEPLALGLYAFGGNFSSRLMARVRDEQGLTYGIHSGLSGVDVHHAGAWRTSVTLSAERFEEGLASTQREIERFVEGGLLESEIATAAMTLAGRHSVALATTHAVADALLAALERGEPFERIDDYPARIAGYGADRVNEAVRRWLDPARLVVAAAGSFSPSAR